MFACRQKTLLQRLRKFMTKKRQLKINHHTVGFTMIEVLIASALLAMFAVGSALVYRTQIGKARDAQRKTEILDLATALRSYRNDFFQYPEEEVVNDCAGTGLSPYINEIPCDPINSGDYVYTYQTNAPQRTNFRLFTKLEADGSTYMLTSDNLVNEYSGTESEGVDPTCGTETKFCFENVCGTCCPGDNYRCAPGGTKCYFDGTCTL